MNGIPSSVRDHAPILHRSTSEICFGVDEVEPSQQPCPLTKTRTRLRQDTGRSLLACSHDESSQVLLAGGAATHGLVSAVYVAFSQHRPLVLTPDAIWMTLAQGFAHHITNHAEALLTLKSARTDESKEFELVAGFLGVTQQEDSGHLEPEIGWAVVEPDVFTQVLNKLVRAGASDRATKRLMTDPQDYRLRELLGVGIPKELVQLMDRFAEGQVFFEETPHSWTLKSAAAITARPITGTQSDMAIHFMDLADGRVVAYTTVRAKEGWGREGRVLIGQLDGSTIQADNARIIAKGLTEFINRLFREEGRYYFDEPSFESELLC